MFSSQRVVVFFVFSSIFAATFIVFNRNFNKRYTKKQSVINSFNKLTREEKKFETKRSKQKNIKFCWQRSTT